MTDFIGDLIAGIIEEIVDRWKLKRTLKKLKKQKWFSEISKQKAYQKLIRDNRLVRRRMEDVSFLKKVLEDEQEREKFELFLQEEMENQHHRNQEKAFKRLQ